MKQMAMSLIILLGGFMVSSCGSKDPHPVVVMVTNKGSIEVTLDRENAPVTVDNFMQYVNEGFFDNTLIHRVVPRFVIQGGGYDTDMRKKPTHEPIAYEETGLPNERGTISMARTNDLNSATAQFFINLVPNTQLDEMQYAVFGTVTDGMAIVDSIADMELVNIGGPFTNFTQEPVIIESVRLK